MKLKIAILTALMSYSSISSAFTFYDCKSVDKEVNQTLTVYQTATRVPSEDVTVKVTSLNSKQQQQYYVMQPGLTKSNGTITVNSFSNLWGDVELSIITNNPFLAPVQVLGGGGGDYYDFPDYGHCPEHSRAPCTLPELPAPSKPDVKKITTIAVLVSNGLTTTYQCND